MPETYETVIRERDAFRAENERLKLRSENERLLYALLYARKNKLLACCECRHVGYDNNRAICLNKICENYHKSCLLVDERQSDENKNQNTNNTGRRNDRSNVPK